MPVAKKIHYEIKDGVALCGENAGDRLTQKAEELTCIWCIRSLQVVLQANLEAQEKRKPKLIPNRVISAGEYGRTQKWGSPHANQQSGN
jgi:hypothetical protein